MISLGVKLFLFFYLSPLFTLLQPLSCHVIAIFEILEGKICVLLIFLCFPNTYTVTYECKNPYGMMGMSANDWVVSLSFLNIACLPRENENLPSYIQFEITGCDISGKKCTPFIIHCKRKWYQLSWQISSLLERNDLVHHVHTQYFGLSLLIVHLSPLLLRDFVTPAPSTVSCTY